MERFKSKMIKIKDAIEITKDSNFICFSFINSDDIGEYEVKTACLEKLPKDGRFIRVIMKNEWFIIRLTK